LTWVVYSRLVKALVAYLATVLIFVIYIKWFSLRKRWLFLAVCALYCGFLVYFLARLGDSVNEYVHFPEYAVLVLLWNAALKRLSPPSGLPLGYPFNRVWITALAVSAILGVLEESYQLILPQRVFDFQDILLNFMGVWLGGLLIWVFEGGKETTGPA